MSFDLEIQYKDGIPFNLRIHNKWVHSKFPEIESKRQFDEFSKNLKMQEIHSMIFVKIGLAYILDYFLDFPYQIYWYEPNPEITEIALKRLRKKFQDFDWRHLPKIHFLKNFDADFIREFGENLIYSELFFLKTYLEKQDFIIIDLYYRKKFYFSVNYHTIKKFETIWISNFYKNFIFSEYFYPIDVLKNILKSFPVLVIAGGPSLDLWLPIIQMYQNKVFIIAVDTAFNALVQNQIQVDFLVTVDAQWINYLHLQGLWDHISYLIADPVVCNLTIRNSIQHAKIFIYNNSLPFVSYLYLKIFPELSFLKSGGSVTTTAIDFANFLNAKSIFLVGADFAFVKNQIHTKYSQIEKQFLYKNHRIESLDFFNYKQITAIPRRYCLDLYKKQIPTNDKLLIFKNWFENNHQLLQKNQFYLLYGNGADLKNTKKVLSKEEFIEQIATYPALTKKIVLENSIKIQNTKKTKEEILIKVYQNLISLKEKIENLLEILEVPSTKNYTEIDNLEKKILNFEELKLLQFTEIHKYFSSFVGDIEILNKQSKEIHNSIKTHIELHLQFIKKSLSILQLME
ncbi:MAG: motility associated factor glycosyltransferase family protein [Leptonema sp. (in: bacteria)]